MEALQDLANHLVSANRWELPRDSRHAFTILGDHGLLDASGVALAHAMVGFRNIAVHDYAALNPDVVRSIAHDRLGDIETLVGGLLLRLRPAPPA